MKEKVYWKSLKDVLVYTFYFVAALWAIRLVGYLFGNDFYTLGILPRTTVGLKGIITAPLIHANFEHLIANTLPIFILTALLFFFYQRKAFIIYITLWLSAGVLTWLIGRLAWHIGISSVIYALASFLIFGGIFSKNIRLILVSVVVLLLYAGLVWGIFPNEGYVSWEGHLAGAISGLVWGYAYRKSLKRL